jgi:hypothetical protein
MQDHDHMHRGQYKSEHVPKLLQNVNRARTGFRIGPPVPENLMLFSILKMLRNNGCPAPGTDAKASSEPIYVL